MSNKLYCDLYNLREDLKEEGRREGRAPLVCSDEALQDIARLKPKKMSDFDAIEGIGKMFKEKYGEAFLWVIQDNLDNNEKSVTKGEHIDNTLRELEKKLVNINRRNRLLFAGTINSKYGYDLKYLEINNINRILFGSNYLSICDLDKDKSNESIKRYRSIVQLLREISKDIRDKGQNDLYIGYPFVIGRMFGEDFDVHSPLALFPITFERNSSVISIKLDNTRDVVYNSTLVLAYYKFNNINQPLPDMVIEDLSKEGFIDRVINFYKEIGINIFYDNTELVKYQEYKTKEFPKYNNGELFLEASCVLGKYQICSSSIQRDFEAIIEEDQINNTLNKLLENIDDVDYFSDYQETDEEKELNELEIKEEELFYINDLNSSQERVVQAINTIDNLVVQGPPGTGKSQVITSLIGDYVNRGLTVLMVSEKKTALDVVYSRLGELSKYVMLIDDVNNKELFYKQLENMLTINHSNEETLDLNYLNSNINNRIDILEEIASILYQDDYFGIPAYKMYLLSEKFNLNKPYIKEKVKAINENFNEELLKIKYEKLESIKNYFSNTELSKKLLTYLTLLNQYNWLKDFNLKLNEYQLLDLETDLNKLLNIINTFNSKNFVVKLFTKRKVLKEVNNFVYKYFSCYDKTTFEFVMNNIVNIIDGSKHYLVFREYKPLYDYLDNNQKMYFDVLYKVCCDPKYYVGEINKDLFNHIVTLHIFRFENENQRIFNNVADYNETIRILSRMINEKKDLSKKGLQALLQNNIATLSESKRFSEISRVVEGKRKWSVNKFVNKFNFELFNNIKVWLLTPEVVSEIIPLQVGLFDLVIFDEASQMYVEKGIPSILRAKKVVIAGDHKQLRPSNLGSGRIEFDVDDLPEDVELGAALEEESLLDLARFKYPDVLIDFHYRSQFEELINFSNYAFYKGKLHVSPNTVKLDKPPIEVHKINDGLWTNRANYNEAKYIVSLLKNFFNTRKENETIGIITFNANQRNMIDDLIDEECANDSDFEAKIQSELMRTKDGEDIGLFVKNIETVQGDERDVIIFSIGYAKNEQGKLIRNFGWLNQKGGENRLNVAITRAKKKIHVVTSILPAELDVEDTLNEGPKYLKKYLEYCFAISNNNKEQANQILLSFANEEKIERKNKLDSTFEEEVYQMLKDKGVDVDINLGIGRYSIALAVKKNGRYVLGIECDEKLYQSFMSTRERDFHRQKYFESRGWRIHRIWSNNWWKNKEQEIAKILNIINSIDTYKRKRK